MDDAVVIAGTAAQGNVLFVAHIANVLGLGLEGAVATRAVKTTVKGWADRKMCSFGMVLMARKRSASVTPMAMKFKLRANQFVGLDRDPAEYPGVHIGIGVGPGGGRFQAVELGDDQAAGKSGSPGSAVSRAGCGPAASRRPCRPGACSRPGARAGLPGAAAGCFLHLHKVWRSTYGLLREGIPACHEAPFGASDHGCSGSDCPVFSAY